MRQVTEILLRTPRLPAMPLDRRLLAPTQRRPGEPHDAMPAHDGGPAENGPDAHHEAQGEGTEDHAAYADAESDENLSHAA